jgi:hypothetical protein
VERHHLLHKYQPIEGDIYIQEVRVGRFAVYRCTGKAWDYQTSISEQEVNLLIQNMQFMGESRIKSRDGTGQRQFYRPAPQNKE